MNSCISWRVRQTVMVQSSQGPATTLAQRTTVGSDASWTRTRLVAIIIAGNNQGPRSLDRVVTTNSWPPSGLAFAWSAGTLVAFAWSAGMLVAGTLVAFAWSAGMLVAGTLVAFAWSAGTLVAGTLVAMAWSAGTLGGGLAAQVADRLV
jgi:hypothetical protein